ncbi:aromatic ring-hydroxylating dioxygenase subunit alpha [Pseudomonas kuykendallii]|uniref:aromatic ring-hydroxylating dioxygenase subunit alpha n=2 Tax=Pseudomonas TaxID=286 RepID=UPI0028969D57|nr:aromatic ring-hydroxylating dioxygenase subunit alpha [Pseudomonas kuykendallii]
MSARADNAFDQWYMLAISDELAPQQARRYQLLGLPVVLWRGEHEARAWLDQCPHRGAALSLGAVSGESLACPYHGWQFDAAGRCRHYPAHPGREPSEQARVRTFHCLEQDGCLWVCPGTPRRPPPRLPEVGDPAYRSLLVCETTVAANAYRVIENFLDMAHFGFVHPGTLGAGDDGEIAAYRLETHDDGFIARDCRVIQRQGNLQAQGPSEVLYDYELIALTSAVLHKKGADGARASDVIRLFVVPLDEERSQLRMHLSYDYVEAVSEADVIAFNRSILQEDVPILESQRPVRLPLHTTLEVSQPADLSSIQYRRHLKRLQIGYGVC